MEPFFFVPGAGSKLLSALFQLKSQVFISNTAQMKRDVSLFEDTPGVAAARQPVETRRPSDVLDGRVRRVHVRAEPVVARIARVLLAAAVVPAIHRVGVAAVVLVREGVAMAPATMRLVEGGSEQPFVAEVTERRRVVFCKTEMEVFL
jgi:hypothetical protein